MPQVNLENSNEAIVRMKKKLGNMETEEGRRKGLQMSTRPDDLFVVTTPKAGTTWTQQIVHQLRCLAAGYERANEFEEISCVVPFIEMAHDIGLDVNAEQVVNPRIFKTHCWYEHCPKGARYIWVVRDPMDVSFSFYKFFEGWLFEPGEVELDDFVEQFILQRGRPENDMQNASYWDHLISWWPRREDDKVLLIFFEDLKDDLKGSVKQIAEFTGWCAGNESLLDEVVRLSSFEYMSSHAGQFDEHVLKQIRNPCMGLPKDTGVGLSKVRQGTSGSGSSQIGEDCKARLEARWKQVEEVTGFASYAEMRRSAGLKGAR